MLIGYPDKDEGRVTYREVSLSSGQASDPPNADVLEDSLFDPLTGLWVGETLRGDDRDTQLFDPKLNAKLQGARRAFPGLAVQVASWNADFSRMIVFTSGSADPGTYWMVDIASGSAKPLGYPYPSLQPSDVGPIRMVDWKAADGLQLHGVLSLPPGRDPKALPLVVMPHGGPETRDYPEFDWWAQAFASRGYAVFQPNFRGSGGYGVDFRNAGFGQWGRKMQTDISDGVAELAREGIVDPKRACIVGGSYGGYASLAGVTVQHGLYRCAVADAPVADLPAFLNYERRASGDQSDTTRYWDDFLGIHGWTQSGLNTISPAQLADRADAPILLIHGKDDTVVPLEQSEAMEAALKRAGKPVELIVMPNEDHWLSREETRVLMLKSAVTFVERYNPPDSAAPDAVTAVAEPSSATSAPSPSPGS